MEVTFLNELIASFGFPTMCVIGLAFYINDRDKAIREDNEKDKERLYEEIKFNRESNHALLESNKMLIQDINIKLEKIEKSLEK